MAYLFQTSNAAALAKRAAILAKLAPARGAVPCLSFLKLQAAGTWLELSATDLDTFATVSVAVDVEESATILVQAAPFADALKAIAKDKGAHVSASIDQETGRLVLVSGRSRVNIATLPADDFPAPADVDASAAWEADSSTLLDVRPLGGVELPKEATRALKAIARLAKDTPAAFERVDVEEETERARVRVDGWTVQTRLYRPDSWKAQKRSRFSYGTDAAAVADARAYLVALRDSLGLPAMETARVAEHGGRAVGLTMGDCRRDYNETRAMPDGWEPPAGVDLEPIAYCAGAVHCFVDGVRFSRMHDGGAWSMHYEAPNPGALVWTEGAYSLPMPADQRRPVSLLTVEVDGVAMPLAADWNGETSREIALTAEEVAELCGPVDPSTFVKIEPLAFHHGRIIARGADAERFNAMQAAFDKNARKALKNCRDSADWNLTAFNIGLSWRDKVAAFLETLEPAAETVPAPIDDGCGLEIEDAAPDGLEPEPVDVEPIEEPAANVIRFEPAGRGFHVAVIEPTPAPAAPVEEPAAAEALPEPPAVIVVDVPPVETPAATAEPLCAGPCGVEKWQCDLHGICRSIEAAEEARRPVEPVTPAPVPSTDLERRLARLEEALGLVERPKRTPAHAAAIRRAWNMRRAMRERADLDRRALLQANGYNRILREENERLSERVKRAEAFATEERAELVATIDAERRNAADWQAIAEQNAAHVDRERVRVGALRRSIKRAAAIRRDLYRTRAEREGLAVNLQALSRRIAEDAARLERLEPSTDRPRIILNAR